MTDPDDDSIDVLLREYFDSRLDAQRGRPARAVARHMRAVRMRRLVLGGAAFCCAFTAALAAMFMLGRASRPAAEHVAPAPPAVVARAPADLPEGMGLSVVSRTIDDGTIACDRGIGLRQVRREVIERAGWIDPTRQARISVTIPRQHIVVFGVEPD